MLLRRKNSLRQDRADLLQSLGRTPEAITVLEDAARDGQKVLEQSDPGTARVRALRNLQVTLAFLAEFHHNTLGPSLEQPERALFYRDKLRQGWKHLISLDPNNADAHSMLAVCESETALTMVELKPKDAIPFARRGLSGLESIPYTGTDDGRIYRTARAATRLAIVLHKAGQPAEAVDPIQQSLRKHRELLSRSKDNPRYLVSLIWSLTALGAIEDSLGRRDKARLAADEAVSISATLAASPDLYIREVIGNSYKLQARVAQLPADRCASLVKLRDLWATSKGPPSPWLQARLHETQQGAQACSPDRAK